MSYPFVKAAFDYGLRTGPVKAFLVHMAEGGGTVGYLSRSPDRGVSVHYVIEYSGRIVQMLPESHASGSVNPNDIRVSDDADGFFGATAARAVLGTWWKNPNAAVISLEMEGYAATGPNIAQQDALDLLVSDVRSRFPDMGLLGHRDLQDYKACPGRRIPWTRIGGHGPFTATEDPMGLHLKLLGTVDATPLDAFLLAKIAGAGHSIFRVADSGRVAVADGLDLGTVQRAQLVGTLPTWAQGDPSGVAFNYGGEQHFAVIRDIAPSALPVPAPPPDTTPFDQAAIDKAVADDRLKARIVYS